MFYSNVGFWCFVFEIKYNYTVSGLLSEIKTPYGNTSYEYDLMERVVRVVDHSGNITVYTYDCLGNRETLTYANGVKVKYEYDENSNLISEEIVDDKSNLIKKCIYERNKNGYPVLIEETSSDGLIQTSYKYDAVNRLVSEKIKDKDGKITYQYKYDKVGNRLSKKTRVKGDIVGIADSDTVIKEGVIEYSYNAGSQLLSEGCDSEEKAYYYDTNGNLTAIVNGSDVQKYEYSKQNKLAKYTDAQGNQTIYTYDGEGNRISKKSDNDCINYVVTTFDELSYTLLELDGSRNLTKYYTIGTDLISQDNTENNYYYILDAHGSVMYLTNSSGNVVNKYRYDAFGNILSKIDKVDNSYYYNCENYDKELGLYYLRARYLNPQTGTFTQEDTYQGNIYDAISLHKYLFAASNPVVYEDPTEITLVCLNLILRHQ